MKIMLSLYSFSIALLTVLFVFIVKVDLGSSAGVVTPFFLFFTAVMLSAWFGGLIAGLFATVISSLISLYFFIPPDNSFAITSSSSLIQLIAFVLESTIISIFIGSHILRKKHGKIKINEEELKKNFKETSFSKQLLAISPQPYVRYIIYIFCFAFIVFLVKLFYLQLGQTSFIDAENNYVVGYFILRGKTVYSQIFLNHQMLMPYISAILQAISHPSSLNRLVVYHRVFIFIFSLIMDALIIYRFSLVGFGFVFFYEIIKYYLFGNFFLAESMIVYPLVYMFGIAWGKMKSNSISKADFALMAFCAWFVIFMREPFIPLALFLYIVFLWNKKITKMHLISIGIFSVLTIIIIASIPIKDYLFQLITINLIKVVPQETHNNGVNGIGVISIFFYIFTLLYSGKWNFFHFDLIGVDVVFLFLIGTFLAKTKKVRQVLFILITLGLAAIRLVQPGTVFYGAFHLLPWTALFIFSTFVILYELYLRQNNEKIIQIICTALLIVFSFLIFTFRWFFTSGETNAQKFDRNYGRYYANGKVIKLLSNPGATLFVDWWGSLVYWESGLTSSYKYTLYYPPQMGISLFDKERLHMFSTNPPDFYYTDCENNPVFLPAFVRPLYVQLLHDGNPGCIFVKRSLLLSIPKYKISQIKKFGFTVQNK